jgi:hypothetical protein
VTRTQAGLVVLAVLLAVAWLAVGRDARLPSPSGGAPRATGAAAGRTRGGDALADLPEAVRALRAAPRPDRPARRNPFSFQEAPPAPAAPPDRAVAAAASAPVPARPDLTLSGIAEEAGRDRPVRTAVLSAQGQLVLAREGDRVLARFLVLRIAADAVQVQDGDGGGVFTLTLK